MTTAQETTGNHESASKERDGTGRFKAGNSGGPGNPFARQVANLRRALLNAVTEQDVIEIIEVLKRKARDGDVAAIRLLLAYSIGKPGPATDPDRVHLDEFKLFEQNHDVSPESLQALLDAIPVDLFLQMAHAMGPALSEAKKKKLHDAIFNPQVDEEGNDFVEDGEEDEEAETLAGAAGSEPVAPAREATPPDWLVDLLRADLEEQRRQGKPAKLPAGLHPRLVQAVMAGAPSTNGSSIKGRA